MPSPHESLAALRRAFPRDPVDAGRFDGYLRELADVPPDILWSAVRELIRTRSYPSFPSLGEIREVCARQTLRLPTEAEALAQIEARRLWGRHREGTVPPLHPLTQEALELVGGFAEFRATDRPGIVKAAFGKYFRELREKALRQVLVGDVAEAAA